MRCTFQLLLLFALFFLCLPWAVMSGEAGPAANDQPTVSQADLTAVFYPRREATLSSDVSSRVVSIRKEMGQSFKKGEVLLELDPSRFRARLSRVQAEVESARVTLEAVKRLYQDRSKSRIEMVEAESTLAKAEADLALAQQDVEACTVRAPFDGRVVKWTANEHELVQRGEKLLHIVDDRILRARFLAPTSELSQIRVGRKVTIHIPILSRTVHGSITHVSPAVDPASRTIEAFAEVRNSDGIVLGGMIGMLRFGDDNESPES